MRKTKKRDRRRRRTPSQERDVLKGSVRSVLDHRPTLSLCMIVRDNERTLDAALSGIAPWVDELIVVDTGSRDGTPQVAERYGAKLFHFTWCDDFARARNESLRHAHGRWLFWMDSDDVIDAANGRWLRDLALGPHAASTMGYVMQVHCPGAEYANHQDVTVVDQIKLIRNGDGIRFEGRIHEQVLPSIRRLGGAVAWTDIFVVHAGADYSAAGRQRKQQRDLRLLELELKDQPNHPFALFNLGMTYVDMGRHIEATRALVRCLEFAAPSESHVRKAYSLLVECLDKTGTAQRAWEVCCRGLQVCPGDPELLFRKGVIAQKLRQHSAAIDAYLSILALREKNRHFTSIDRGILSYKTRHNLAVVYGDIHRPDLAENQWRLILTERPGYQPALRGMVQSMIAQKKFDAVHQEIERLIEILPEPERLVLCADIALAEGDLQRSVQLLRHALDIQPAHELAQNALATALCRSGDLNEAERLLTEIAAREDPDGAALHNLGTIYLQSGRFTQAIDALERSLHVRPHASHTAQQLRYARKQVTQ